MPDQSSLLYANLSAFYDNNPWNYTIVNNATFHELAQSVRIPTLTSLSVWYTHRFSILEGCYNERYTSALVLRLRRPCSTPLGLHDLS